MPRKGPARPAHGKSAKADAAVGTQHPNKMCAPVGAKELSCYDNPPSRNLNAEVSHGQTKSTCALLPKAALKKPNPSKIPQGLPPRNLPTVITMTSKNRSAIPSRASSSNPPKPKRSSTIPKKPSTTTRSTPSISPSPSAEKTSSSSPPPTNSKNSASSSQITPTSSKKKLLKKPSSSTSIPKIPSAPSPSPPIPWRKNSAPHPS